MPRRGKPAVKGGDDQGGTKRSGRSKNLVPAVTVALGLVVGGKLMTGGGSDAGADLAAGQATTTTAVPGPVQKLDPITLNLVDGRFLRIGVGLQLASSEEGAAEEAVEPDATDALGHYAKALDLIIRSLGSKTYDELVRPEGRLEAKRVLVDELIEAYPDEIEDLYFTEFVLQ